MATDPTPLELARKVLRRSGIARTSELERGGVSRTQVRRLVGAEKLERLGRGLYALPDRRVSELSDLAEAAARVPAGVVCLLSALRFHGLTTENPSAVWMAVPWKAWRPTGTGVPLTLVFLSEAVLKEGVEAHDMDGVRVRVFSAAKTVADCFKFRNKLGTEVAVEALRDYRRKFPKRLDDVWKFAKVDRVSRVIQPYLESLE